MIVEDDVFCLERLGNRRLLSISTVSLFGTCSCTLLSGCSVSNTCIAGELMILSAIFLGSIVHSAAGECVAEWLRRLTRKPKVRMAVGSNPTLDSLVALRDSSLGRPEPCEGNLVASAGSCSGLMVKHQWPLLEISLSDFRRLATLKVNTYLGRSGDECARGREKHNTEHREPMTWIRCS